MTAAGWIAIAVSVGSHAFAVVWWLVRRPIGRLDRLEAAVFGESGVNMKLTKYVTHEGFEKRMASIDAHLLGVSEEGQKREERILQAIENQTRQVSQQLGEMRSDVRQQSARIDNLMNRGA